MINGYEPKTRLHHAKLILVVKVKRSSLAQQCRQVVSRAGSGLKSAGSGQAWALHCGLGLYGPDLAWWAGLGSGLRA
jgi:hypothetical protein